MTIDDCINLANELSDRKGEKVLSLDKLFWFVAQDICKRNRFWWRRVLQSFPITAGTSTYDLTNSTLFPNFANIALEEITKFSVVTASSPLTFSELSPITDPQSLIDMIANTTSVQPGRYTMDANDYKTIRIDLPDANYTAYIIGWGMPSPSTGDQASKAVPLIPPWGHNTIVHGISRHVYEHVYGAGHAKTQKAAEEYEQGIMDLAMRKTFDPNYRPQLVSTEDAVRST